MNYEERISPTATNSYIGQAAAPSADTPGVIAPPPLIYLGALGVGFGLNAVIGGASLPSTVARPVGAALIVAGAGLMGTFVRAFGRARTPLDPYTPSEAIVTDGPYRLSRNPAYLGMTLTYAGIAIVSNAPCAARHGRHRLWRCCLRTTGVRRDRRARGPNRHRRQSCRIAASAARSSCPPLPCMTTSGAAQRSV